MNKLLIGYGLFNKLRLTTQVPKKHKYYVNEYISNTDNIYISIDLELNEANSELLTLLEVVEYKDSIEDFNENQYQIYLKKFPNNNIPIESINYICKEVLPFLPYKETTIKEVYNILREKEKGK